MNQAPRNLTTDVVFGSRALRFGYACRANAIAPLGRINTQRPTAPNSTKKKPMSVIPEPFRMATRASDKKSSPCSQKR
jgi:hypothetical protein